MTKLFAHQQATFEKLKDRSYAALFQECGCGKSLTAITLAEHHYSLGHVTAVLLIAPKGVLGNWAFTELPKHSTVPWSTFVWNGKSSSNGLQGFLWFIVNVDGILSKDFPLMFKAFLKKHPNFAFIADESTAFKSSTALRTKRATSIARLAKYRYIMTGTPSPNSPLDLYSQCELLAPNALGFSNKFAFRARYADTFTMNLGNRSFQKIKGYRNLGELTQTLNEIGSIIKKKDCLDLPPKMYRTIDVPLTPEQQKYHDELKAQALTYVQGNEVSVVNEISLINKLLQICSGQIKLPDGTYLSIPNNRLDMLSELVNECEGKTIIWASFVSNALDIKNVLGDDCLALPSGITLEARQAILEEFRNGPAKALVANPSSSGHGITLVESSNVIYYSNTWNFEHRAQSEDRTHRIGQVNSVLYTDLVAKGTGEERVIKALADKKALSDLLITSKSLVREIFS